MIYGTKHEIYFRTLSHDLIASLRWNNSTHISFSFRRLFTAVVVRALTVKSNRSRPIFTCNIYFNRKNGKTSMKTDLNDQPSSQLLKPWKCQQYFIFNYGNLMLISRRKRPIKNECNQKKLSAKSWGIWSKPFIVLFHHLTCCSRPFIEFLYATHEPQFLLQFFDYKVSQNIRGFFWNKNCFWTLYYEHLMWLIFSGMFHCASTVWNNEVSYNDFRFSRNTNAICNSSNMLLKKKYLFRNWHTFLSFFCSIKINTWWKIIKKWMKFREIYS